MKLDLKNKEWGEFLFPEIFKIEKGFYNKKPDSTLNGTIPFLGATANNNGITEFYTLKSIEEASRLGFGKNEPLEKKIFRGNCIAVTNNGSVGHAYYQKVDFTCSHDINPLYLRKIDLNENLAKFLITTIEKQKVCFEYARKWRPMRMVKSKILLPITDQGKPDYVFMENYVRQLEKVKQDEYISYIQKRIKELKEIQKPVSLKDKEWKDFFIEEIAEITSGRDIYATERIKGNVPYITATANNNGIGYFVGNNNKSLDSNCLSVNRNGSVGYSFYHPYKALFSNDCRRLKLIKPSKYIGLFISNQITMQKEKYGYGYKMGTARLLKQKILLPITNDGKPDYDFMENYMKSLEYKKLKEYLDYKLTKND